MGWAALRCARAAMGSQKGGAGKSTLALHLATEATTRGTRTVLIDLDPQGNVAGWGGRRGDRPPDVCAEHPANLERAIASASTRAMSLQSWTPRPMRTGPLC